MSEPDLSRFLAKRAERSRRLNVPTMPQDRSADEELTTVSDIAAGERDLTPNLGFSDWKGRR